MASPLDRDNKHALVFRTGPRNTLRDDASLLRNEPLELFLVLVIHVEFLVIAESACALFPHLAVLLTLVWSLSMKCHGLDPCL